LETLAGSLLWVETSKKRPGEDGDGGGYDY
jgi:hypothetical protein